MKTVVSIIYTQGGGPAVRRLTLAATLAGGVIVALLDRLFVALRRVWLELRLGLVNADLQLLNTHAQRMAAERQALILRRADLALKLLALEPRE